jgi:H+/Cl- antiporter ClcA
MEASAEERSGYLDFSKVSPGELMGMGAALVLLGSLWLPWFTTNGDNPNSALVCGDNPPSDCAVHPGESANAWQVFSTLDLLLVGACLAPFILTWIIARGHKLTWKPGEVTMIVGIVAFMLILCNGIILGRPGDSVDIGLGIGYFVGLVASAGLLVAGYLRQAIYGDPKKPPGVI